MLFPEWGQGRHCSCSQELRGDRLQKLHLILTYVVLGCQRRAGWDPQERPVRVRTMVLAQPAPPLNTCCGSHLCSGLGTDALRVSVQGPPQANPIFQEEKQGGGLQMGGDMLRGTPQSKGAYSSVPLFSASSGLVRTYSLASRSAPDCCLKVSSAACSLRVPWRRARPREVK